MLKLTALALGLLSIIAIALPSQATTNVRSLSLQQSTGDLHSQVILKVSERENYRRRVDRRQVVRGRQQSLRHHYKVHSHHDR